MIQINVLELALRDPSRLTADLAGHTRQRSYQPPTRHRWSLGRPFARSLSGGTMSR
jgi:hypothetical protein